jgi:hypothetical protein
VSPAGDDVARLPPIVPALRICGELTVREASARGDGPGPVVEETRVCDASAYPDVVTNGHVAQLVDTIDGNDVGRTLPSEVHFDHQVGAAGESLRTWVRSQRC